MEPREMVSRIAEVSGRITGLSVHAGEYSAKLENALLDCAELLDGVVEDIGVLIYLDGNALDRVLSARREHELR